MKLPIDHPNHPEVWRRINHPKLDSKGVVAEVSNKGRIRRIIIHILTPQETDTGGIRVGIRFKNGKHIILTPNVEVRKAFGFAINPSQCSKEIT